MKKLLLIALLLPLIELSGFPILSPLRTILIFALLGLGLTIVTGYTGILHLGCAAFMAIGAYAYAIATSPLYPFQIGGWAGLFVAMLSGLSIGALLGLPALRLRGDYLAIVTLGFGEIVQDVLRNLEVITKGVQGINPLPAPSLGVVHLSSSTPFLWYYFLLACLLVAYRGTLHLERSRVGRGWFAIREDELAARCMGLKTMQLKLAACAYTGMWCALAGALWAALFGSTGEPGNYDFNVSILALCIVIVGGLGSLRGVIIGAAIMIGFNSIVLTELARFVTTSGLGSTSSVFSTPTNWKYLLFGLALLISVRLGARRSVS